MPGRFPAEVLSKFPHLGPNDVEVAQAWLSSDLPRPARIDYDVRVGAGIPVASGIASDLRVDWKALTQLRIDAVGYDDDSIWIIEFKPRMNLSGVGQLVSYRQLYITERAPALPVRTVLVTFETLPDLLPVYRSQQIEVMVVPRLTPAL